MTDASPHEKDLFELDQRLARTTGAPEQPARTAHGAIARGVHGTRPVRDNFTARGSVEDRPVRSPSRAARPRTLPATTTPAYAVGAAGEELAGALSPLLDGQFFEQVFIDCGAVAWPGEIDLAPDAMYAQVVGQRDGLQHVG